MLEAFLNMECLVYLSMVLSTGFVDNMSSQQSIHDQFWLVSTKIGQNH